jgi:membrane-associated protein
MRHLLTGALGIDPEWLIKTFGTVGIFLIVFAESGLLIGFFLPGDSLLFAAGLFSARGDLPNIAILAVGCAVAAVAGDQVGYMIGKKAGPRLFNRPESKLFKRENVMRAEEFFEKYGPRAIILARFVPIVRTFVPMVAGVSNMEYRKFVTFNVVGGVVWGAGFTTLGWALGQRFPALVDRIEIVAIVIVFFSLIPIAVEVIKHRRAAAAAVDAGAAAAIEELGEEVG